jgi:phosphatidylethanolamine-binding protein (PEBP) family uncharacterized protein
MSAISRNYVARLVVFPLGVPRVPEPEETPESSQPNNGRTGRAATIGGVFIAGGIALSFLCAGSLAQAADPFKLTSSTLEDNGKLAIKNAGNNKQNPNCVGENVSPPLAWSNPLAGTTSYALVMYDPEGRGGLGVVHWVAYGIPASVAGFAEGRGQRPVRQVRGRQEHARAGALFRAMYAARRLAPLYVHADRHRSRPQGARARPDP